MEKQKSIKEIVKHCAIHDLDLRNTEVKFLDRKIVIHAWCEEQKREVDFEVRTKLNKIKILFNSWEGQMRKKPEMSIVIRRSAM